MAGARDSVAFPLASHLRAAIREDAIILSWIDSPLEAKAYVIYRSETAFSEAPLSGTTSIAVVAPGKGSFVDHPPQGRFFFYAVAAISVDGQVAYRYVPSENATTVAISSEAALATITPSPAAAVSPSPAAIPSAPVAAAPAATPPVAAAPAVQAPPAAKPEPPAPVQAEPPVAVAMPSAPVEVPLPAKVVVVAEPPKAEAAVTSRSSPLPAFVYGTEAAPAREAIAGQDGSLPPEMAKALDQLQEGAEEASARSIPSIRFLQRQPQAGDSATILLAAESLLTAGDWPGAIAMLRTLLLGRAGKAEKTQAHYYLGLALAYQGSYRDALFELLDARADYPVETKPWIDFIVESLSRSWTSHARTRAAP